MGRWKKNPLSISGAEKGPHEPSESVTQIEEFVQLGGNKLCQQTRRVGDRSQIQNATDGFGKELRGEKWLFFKILGTCSAAPRARRNPGSEDGFSGDGLVQPWCSGQGKTGKIGRFPGIFLHSCLPTEDYCCRMSCFTAKPSCLHGLRRSLGDRGQAHHPALPSQRDTRAREKCFPQGWRARGGGFTFHTCWNSGR